MSQTIRVEGARTYAVERWAACQRICREVIEHGDPAHVSRDGDMLTLTVANGWARYRLTEPLLGDWFEAELVESEWREPRHG